MVRFIYRMFIVTIISSSLITQSLAEITNNADGTRSSTSTQQVKGHKNETSMASQITMGAIGLIASRLYSYKFTPDIMMAAVGGGVFLWGELTSTSDVQDEEVKITHRSDGKVDNKQMEQLEKLRDSLQKAKEQTEKKKGLQNAAAVAFLAAAAAAILLKSSVETAKTACLTANTTADMNCAVVCGFAPMPLSAGGGALESAKISLMSLKDEILGKSVTKKAENTTSKATLAAQQATTSASVASASTACSSAAAAAATCPGPCNVGAPAVAAAGIGKCNAALASRNAACQSWSAADEAAKSYGSFGVGAFGASPIFEKYHSPKKAVAKSKTNPNFLEKLLNLVIARADAGGMGAALFGASGAAAGLMLSASMGAMVDTWLFTPLKRAAIWGTLAALTYTAASATGSAISDMEGSLTKVNAIIQSLQSNGEGSFGKESQPVAEATTGLGAIGGAFAVTTPDKNPSDCLTGPGNKDCKSAEKAIQKSDNWKDTPPELQSVMKDVGKLGDRIQGQSGLTADTLGAAGALAGQGSSVHGMLSKAQAKLNAHLVKNGKPAIDFTKEEGAFSKMLLEKAQESLKKSGASTQGLLASAGPGLGSSTKTDAKTEAPATLLPTSDSDLSPSAGNSATEGAFKFKSDSNVAANAGAANVTEEGVNNMAKMDEANNENTIHEDDGYTIFEVITTRYQRSAYPRLFSKLKE